jgi:SAM-dependent methyltransferase
MPFSGKYKMKPAPSSEIYEEELKYMPYRTSLRRVTNILCSQIPLNGSLLDLMCGPGFLLGQINAKRADLSLQGVDSDESYIAHAQEKYPGIDFAVGDVLVWKPKQQVDVAICTGALHHIPYERQAEVIETMSAIIRPNGFALISDCYVADYTNETERKLAAARLGYEYLRGTIRNGAPGEVIDATIDIFRNDVLMNEFKTSMAKRMPAFRRFFRKVETRRTWPAEGAGYGDYITILRK